MSINLSEIAFSKLQADSDLVISFFASVSRFEYAAKKARPDQYVKARGDACLLDWMALGESLDYSHEVYQSDSVKSAINNLLKKPPEVLSRDMIWTERDLDGKNDLAKAVMAVNRVRNNLFHGNKGLDKARNNKLLRSSVSLITAIVVEQVRIQEVFLEPA